MMTDAKHERKLIRMRQILDRTNQLQDEVTKHQLALRQIREELDGLDKELREGK